jgi:hypothetical protein
MKLGVTRVRLDVWKGPGGNREVPPFSISGPPGDSSGAGPGAKPKEGSERQLVTVQEDAVAAARV